MTRSAALPAEVEALLGKIREADANGESSDGLRAQLMQAIKMIRPATTIVSNRPPPLDQPRMILITAKRSQPGAEKAQVVAGGQGKAPPMPVAAASGKQRPTFDQLADLMRQINLAEAQGQPADNLRRQMTRLIEQMKR